MRQFGICDDLRIGSADIGYEVAIEATIRGESCRTEV